jgi:N-acetylglucosamine-6-phosphate deacetylase
MPDTSFVLENARLVLPDRVLEGGAVVVEDGRIAAILEAGESPPTTFPRRDLGGAWLTPGLVEVHIHGCGGVGFDDLGPDLASGVAALLRARDFLRSRGVTCFVPTLVCREPELAALAAALEAAGIPESEVPGIYVEGPFIAAKRRGGIPLDTIKIPDAAALEHVLALGRGRIRLMTVAPELPGVAAIMEALTKAGVLPCLGHSDADLETTPLPEGAFSITHLFNAMSPFSHREAGLAMLPFLPARRDEARRDEAREEGRHDGHRPFVELNADGVHVGGPALRIASSGLDSDRLILISDAVVAAGLPYGDYSYYGMTVRSGPDGVRYADSGVLMGSNRLAPEILRNWLKITGASVPDAVRAMTLTPARALGLAKERGSLEEGKLADLVAWKGDFESVTTMP